MKHLRTCILFMISTFTFGQEKMPKEIKGSKLIQYLLVSDTSGRMGVFDSSASEIYSNGNVLLYDLTYHYSSSLNEIELVSEERHHYFIHSKDSLYGYDYDGYKQPFVRRIRVDSVLSPTRSANMDIREVFARNESKLIASKHNSDSGTAHETYIVDP